MHIHFKIIKIGLKNSRLFFNRCNKSYYLALGLAGETGEVIEKIKKVFIDKEGKFGQEQLELIKKELGDVLWYLTQIATDLGISMEDVAKHNIEKLYSRFDRGVIKGSGDTR